MLFSSMGPTKQIVLISLGEVIGVSVRVPKGLSLELSEELL
jgi:hypothetical protein